jgi:SGNH domain (fused to AT3 domains)
MTSRYDDATIKLISANANRKNEFTSIGCENFMKPIKTMADIDFCTIGNQQTNNVLLWGDSHVWQLYPLLKSMYDKGDFAEHGLVFAISLGCLPALHMNRAAEGYHCDAFSHFALLRAQSPDSSTVYIGFSGDNFRDNGMICTILGGKCVDNITVMQQFAASSRNCPITSYLSGLWASG